jgi:hypothetical protein
MRGFAIGALLGVALAGATGAAAFSTHLFTLRNGDKFTTRDRALLCVMESGTILCGKAGHPNGYTIGISPTLVAVSLGNRFIFQRRP